MQSGGVNRSIAVYGATTAASWVGVADPATAVLMLVVVVVVVASSAAVLHSVVSRSCVRNRTKDSESPSCTSCSSCSKRATACVGLELETVEGVGARLGAGVERCRGRSSTHTFHLNCCFNPATVLVLY